MRSDTKQLTLGDVLALSKQFKKDGMSANEIANIPIYLGRDDELNGIHTGWYVNTIDKSNINDDDKYFIDMINEDISNVSFTDEKCILIS